MNETIKSIKEITNINITNKYGDICYYAGYEIITTQQSVRFLIEDEANCCERWGYMTSEDSVQSFVGHELRDIVLVDTNLKTKKYIEQEYGSEEKICSIVFINIITDLSVLQFAIYNCHNGYYGHDVIIESNQLKLAKNI